MNYMMLRVVTWTSLSQATAPSANQKIKLKEIEVKLKTSSKDEERKDHAGVRKEDTICKHCVKETPLLDLLKEIENSHNKG